jgi:hypothetical protein
MKFVIFKIFVICILSLKLIESIKLKNKLKTAEFMKNELDNLISFLEKNKHPQAHKELKDKIFESFHSLNQDFIEYEDLLLDRPDDIQKLFYKNDQHNKQIEKINFYDGVQEIAKQIEESIHSIGKIEKNEDEKHNVEQEIAKIKEIKLKLKDVKYKIEKLQKEKKNVHQNIESVRSSISCLFNMYDKLVEDDKKLHIEFEVELNNLKNDFDESEQKTLNINHYFRLYHKLEEFYLKLATSKISSGDIKSQNNFFKPEEINKIISQLNNLHSKSEIIKKKVEKLIKKLNSSISLPISEKISKKGKIIKSLKKLKNMNNRVLKLKENIGNKLKLIYMTNLQGLTQLIKHKKGLNEKYFSQLVHLKDALQLGRNIFENKKKLEQIKNLIQRNLQESENNINIYRDNLNKNLETKLEQTRIKKEHIAEIRNKLIQRYFSIHNYITEMKKLKKILHNEKKKFKIKQRISNAQEVIKRFKELINNSRHILLNLNKNTQLNKEYKEVYINWLGEVKKLKLKIDNTTQDESDKKLEDLNKKLRKLVELYSYIKRGSLDNFIKSELMKKIVNLNDTVIHQDEINKVLLHAEFSNNK